MKFHKNESIKLCISKFGLQINIFMIRISNLSSLIGNCMKFDVSIFFSWLACYCKTHMLFENFGPWWLVGGWAGFEDTLQI